MARYQVDAVSEAQAAEGLAELPLLETGDQVSLCCSACGALLEQQAAPSLVAPESFRAHVCGGVRDGGGEAGVTAAGPPPEGDE